MRGDLRGVFEIVVRDRGDSFRGMYCIGKERIYVLNVFKKKSKRGIATPKKELELVRGRLEWAQAIERENARADEVR
jgi:phage-related protein